MAPNAKMSERGVGGFAPDLFGRHVADSPHDGSGLGADLLRGRIAGYIGLGTGELGQTEVENFCATIVGEEEVLRLKVAMDNALLVGGGEATGDLLAVVDRFARSKWTIAQAVAERLAFQQFGDYIGRAMVSANVRFTDIKDRKDVGVVEGGRGAGFLREALQAVGVGGKRRGQNLDGDVALQAGVAGAVHLAHSTCTERRLNFVGA